MGERDWWLAGGDTVVRGRDSDPGPKRPHPPNCLTSRILNWPKSRICWLFSYVCVDGDRRCALLARGNANPSPAKRGPEDRVRDRLTCQRRRRMVGAMGDVRAWSLLAAVFVPAAAARAGDAKLRILWTAPAGCPDQAEVVREVEELLRQPLQRFHGPPGESERCFGLWASSCGAHRRPR